MEGGGVSAGGAGGAGGVRSRARDVRQRLAELSPEGTWKEALAAFTQAIGAQTMETREHLLGGTARRFYRIGDNA